MFDMRLYLYYWSIYNSLDRHMVYVILLFCVGTLKTISFDTIQPGEFCKTIYKTTNGNWIACSGWNYELAQKARNVG